MQKMNMFLYLLNFSKFISYHSLRSLEVITNSLLGQEETTFHAMRRGEITPLQPMRGNGLFCKLKLNICFLREKVWFIKINYVIFVPEIISVKSDVVYKIN